MPGDRDSALVDRLRSAAPPLRLVFQPIVDLARGHVVGYEALSRFEGPPSATPDRWFAAAHEAGLGDVLEGRAVALALAARAVLPPDCFLTVNASPGALLTEAVTGAFAAGGDLRGVVLEITEAAPVDDYDALEAVLAPLREAGAMVAVDDAGAGFASLQHIARLRPELIKVDRQLVSGVDADPVKAALVETLGVFGSRIDAWLLAEGIETLPELDRLLDLGVPLGQGYGLGRPAPAMAGVDPAAAALCARRAAVRDMEGVRALLQPVPRIGDPVAPAAVARALEADPAAHWVAVVDAFGRPLELRHRDGAAGVRRPLSVLPTEAPADVLARAVTRQEADRFSPLVVCDERGGLVGIVTVERLIGAVTARPAAPAAVAA